MQISKYLNMLIIIVLFAWISLFPASIHLRYQVATNIFLLLAFLDLWARKGNSLFKSTDLPLLGFLVAIGLNVFLAKQRTTALGTYLNLALPMLSIYYLVSENFSTETSFSILAKTITMFSILLALLGVMESLFRFNPMYEYFINNPYYRRYITGFVRPMSTQFSPVILGAYLLASLPFNLILFKGEKRVWRILGAVGLVVNTVIIILTFSRSVFLGLVALIVSYLAFKNRFRSLIIFLIILFAFIAICSYLPYPFERFGANLMTTGSCGMVSSYRFERLSMVYQIIKEHPFIGIGLNHFRIRFYEYYPYQKNVPYEFMIADNMYLAILSEAGIIGLAGFLLFIGTLIARAWKKNKAILELCVFIGLLTSMGGFELFYWPSLYIYFCILAGLLRAD